ncbi:23303_t:CDS:1, partial [Gigaspora rosea]
MGDTNREQNKNVIGVNNMRYSLDKACQDGANINSSLDIDNVDFNMDFDVDFDINT